MLPVLSTSRLDGELPVNPRAPSPTLPTTALESSELPTHNQVYSAPEIELVENSDKSISRGTSCPADKKRVLEVDQVNDSSGHELTSQETLYPTVKNRVLEVDQANNSSSDESIPHDARPASRKRALELNQVNDSPAPKRSQRLKRNPEANDKEIKSYSPQKTDSKSVETPPPKKQAAISDGQFDERKVATELRGKNHELLLQLKTREEKFSKEKFGLELELSESRKEASDLHSSLSQLQDELERLRKSDLELRRCVYQLEEEKNKLFETLDLKVSDDTIHQKWCFLGLEIQNFVLNLVNENPHKKTRRESVANLWAQKLLTLRARWRKCANVKSHFLIQQYIWTRIIEEIFYSGASAWGVDIGIIFQEFFHRLGDEYFDQKEEFSAYKSRLAHALVQAREKDGDVTISNMAEEIRKELWVFTDMSKKEEFVSRMRQILKCAVDLLVIFMTSRAFFIPKPVFDTDQLDYRTMEVRFVDGGGFDEDNKLDIVISPMVEKVGNADGHMFKTRRIICKAFVTAKAG